MEDALRGLSRNRILAQSSKVLILILMEDALRAEKETVVSDCYASLNPYSNGRCSKRLQKKTFFVHDLTLS